MWTKRRKQEGEVKGRKYPGQVATANPTVSSTGVLPDKNMWEEKPKKKKKKPAGPLSVTDMLRKFQKQKDKEKLKREKEREQQKFGLEKTTLPTTPYVSADPVGGGANMADPLLSLIGSTNDRAFLQAASTVDFDLDLDTLLDASAETLANQVVVAMTLTNQEVNAKTLAYKEVNGLCGGAGGEPPASTLESHTQTPIDPVPHPQDQIDLVSESISKPQAPKPSTQPQAVSGPQVQPPSLPTPLPEGLSSAMEKRAQDLALAAKGLEGESKVKFFTPEVNAILLDIELQCRDVSGQVRSKVYTHLASFLPCSRETLLKRVKKLLLTQVTQECVGRVCVWGASVCGAQMFVCVV
ncbi:ubinuclein-1 [Oncorhynchus masou masou]|uniref:ubinuclein-1 n=1 Tax=Oncorhynchus masou masou TaxID=90313 RepID=UPI00318353D5